MVRVERLDQGAWGHAMVALPILASAARASLTLAWTTAGRWTVLRNQHRRERPNGKGEKGDVLFHSGVGLDRGVQRYPNTTDTVLPHTT